MGNLLYCSQGIDENFLCLLNFARISENETSLSAQGNLGVVRKTLNSLSSNSLPSLRPLIPLIYRNLVKTKLIEQLQPDIQMRIRHAALALNYTEMLGQQWLEEITASLEKKNISIILLKSTAFSRNLYPPHAPRIGVDIDLLVTEDTFDTACEILTKTMNPVLQSSDRVATYNTLFERVFRPKQGEIPTVEVHRALTNPYIFSIDEQTLWNHSRKHPAYNSELVRTLSPEDTLLHLAIHAFRDLNFCTHNLLDAHEVWCQWNPEPDVLLEKAKQWGAAKVLYYLLENTRRTMNTPIPDTLLIQIKPPCLQDRLNKKILRTIKQEAPSNKSYRYRATQLMSQITFPDHPARGLKFQAYYIQTRIKDWYLNKRRQPNVPVAAGKP